MSEIDLLAASNKLVSFLALRDIADLSKCPKVSAIVVCGSAVLSSVEAAVAAFNLGLAPLIVFSGGLGHSTVLLYEAVGRSRFSSVVSTASQPTEAEVMRDLALALGVPQSAVLIESASTNCGSNASLSRVTLEKAGVAHPHSLLILQDPTMQLRTHASFRKAYTDAPDTILLSWAPIIPTLSYRLSLEGGGALLQVSPPGVWTDARFFELLLGEVPRLRDAPGGYGPKGSGFIAHVDVGEEVEAAHAVLSAHFESSRAVVNKQ